tara:strand:- start:6256 stop:10152 length:3897 start_codon:yes stop_codon:yes gene_type:complete
MAVIKEQKQFKIGAIGVARASEGSAILGNAVTNSMTKLAGIAADEATLYAAKIGAEQGSKVITIDPKTGLPNALDVPTGYGRVAAEAYTRTAMTRFDRAIDTEIKVKSAELAEKYERSGNAAVLYEQGMKNYIASMTDAASDGYKQVIADKGADYTAITSYNLAEAQRKREFAAAKTSHLDTISESFQGIEQTQIEHGIFMGRSAGRASAYADEKNPIDYIIESSKTLITDGLEAGYYNQDEADALYEGIYDAQLRGKLTYLVNQENDPVKLALLNSAIATNNPSAIPEGYEEIKQAMFSLGNDLEAKDRLTKHASSMISARSVTANIITDKATAENQRLIDEQANSLIVGLVTTSEARQITMEKVASRVHQGPPGHTAFDDPQPDATNLVGIVTSNFRLAQEQALALRNQKKPDAANAVLAAERDNAKGTAKGLSTALLAGLTVLDLGDINQAVETGDYSGIDPVKVKILKGIQDLSLIEPSIKKDFADFLKLSVENADLVVQLQMLKTKNGNEHNVFSNARDTRDAEQGITADEIIKSYLRMQEEVAQLRSEGLGKSADTMASNFEGEVKAAMGGAAARIFEHGNGYNKPLTVEQAKLVIDAATSRNSSKLPPKAKAIFDLTILKLQEETGVDGMALLKSLAESYKSNGAQVITEMLKGQAALGANSFSGDIADLASIEFAMREGSDINTIEQGKNLLEFNINRIENLDDTERDAHIADINENAAKAYLSNLFYMKEIIIKDGQIEAAQSILAGGINRGEGVNELSDAQVGFLKRARALAAKAKNPTDVNTFFNVLKKQRVQEIAARKVKEAVLQRTVEFGQGQLDPKSESDRDFASEYIEQTLGVTNLYAAMQDRSFFRSTQGQEIVNLIRRTGVAPSEMITMLNNVASGNLDSLNASSALEIYIDFKDYIFNGKVLASKALSGLDPETVATLDHLQSATLVRGNTNAAIGDIINQYKESLDPKLKEFYDAKVASYLKLDTEGGETLTTWLLESVEGADEIPTHYQPTLRIMAETLVRHSIINPNLQTKSQIVRSLEYHIEKNYPRPENPFKTPNPFDVQAQFNRLSYAVRSNDIGTGARTGATLGQSVPGFESEFAEVVEKMIREEGDVNPLDPVQLGPNFVLGEPATMADFKDAPFKYSSNVSVAGTYYLQPMGPLMNGRVEYAVMKVTQGILGGPKQVMTTKTFYEVDGKKATIIKVPMYVTNQDPNFLAIKRLSFKGIAVSNLTAGQLSLKRREEIAAGEQPTDLPVEFEANAPSTYFPGFVNTVINTYQGAKKKSSDARKNKTIDWGIGQ